MHRGSSGKVCRRVAGQVNRQLDKISNHTPSAGVSAGRGKLASFSNETSSMTSAPRCISSPYVWYKWPLCSISGGASMVRSARSMSFISHLMARAEGIHTGQHLQGAKKPQQVVADADTDFDLEDMEEQKKVREQPQPRQTLQDEADERATTPPAERLGRHDGEHEPLVDEEVRRGLVADSQVPYGHDREAR